MNIPPAAMTQARHLLRAALANPADCESGLAMGWWIEAHTMFCKGDDEYVSLYEKYVNDGISVILGDPGEGAFVSATPVAGTQYQMGAEELIELGSKARKRVSISTAKAISEEVVEGLAPYSEVVLVAGSIRRKKKDIGDIDIIVLPKDLEDLTDYLDASGWAGGPRKQTKKVKGINVEVHVVHRPEELGGHLFMYTGDQIFEIAMRSKAKREGWKLNQYGIYDAKTGAVILESADERDFFDALGVPYHTPEERSLKDRKKASMGYFEELSWA